MSHTPPTLDYAAPRRNARLRKWTRRIGLTVPILGCLYTTPIAWLYWGWKQEQPARGWGGFINSTKPAGPAFLERFIPARLGWIRERVASLELYDPTDDDLRTLRRLRRLEWLYLGCSRATTDAGLAHLKGLRQLKWLWLDGTPITDSGLETIESLTNLQVLDLRGTRVTDAGLAHLKRLMELRELHLAETKVTDAGVAELRKALPRCKIHPLNEVWGIPRP